jgi:hypothetical protein
MPVCRRSVNRIGASVVLTVLNVLIDGMTIQSTLGDPVFPLVLALVAGSVITLARVWHRAVDAL